MMTFSAAPNERPVSHAPATPAQTLKLATLLETELNEIKEFKGNIADIRSIYERITLASTHKALPIKQRRLGVLIKGHGNESYIACIRLSTPYDLNTRNELYKVSIKSGLLYSQLIKHEAPPPLDDVTPVIAKSEWLAEQPITSHFFMDRGLSLISKETFDQIKPGSDVSTIIRPEAVFLLMEDPTKKDIHLKSTDAYEFIMIPDQKTAKIFAYNLDLYFDKGLPLVPDIVQRLKNQAAEEKVKHSSIVLDRYFNREKTLLKKELIETIQKEVKDVKPSQEIRLTFYAHGHGASPYIETKTGKIFAKELAEIIAGGFANKHLKELYIQIFACSAGNTFCELLNKNLKPALQLFEVSYQTIIVSGYYSTLWATYDDFPAVFRSMDSGQVSAPRGAPRYQRVGLIEKAEEPESKVLPAPIPVEVKETPMGKTGAPAILLDFDLTIPSGHLNYIIAKAEATARNKHRYIVFEESKWNLVKSIHPIKSPTVEWHTLIPQLIKAGHPVAIVSFSNYPYIIKRYLKEVLHIPADLLEKIIIKADLPLNHRTISKHNHIAYVKRLLGIDNNKNIIFVDDDEDNCIAAQIEGCSVIKANSEGDHLTHLNAFLTSGLLPPPVRKVEAKEIKSKPLIIPKELGKPRTQEQIRTQIADPLWTEALALIKEKTRRAPIDALHQKTLGICPLSQLPIVDPVFLKISPDEIYGPFCHHAIEKTAPYYDKICNLEAIQEATSQIYLQTQYIPFVEKKQEDASLISSRDALILDSIVFRTDKAQFLRNICKLTGKKAFWRYRKEIVKEEIDKQAIILELAKSDGNCTEIMFCQIGNGWLVTDLDQIEKQIANPRVVITDTTVLSHQEELFSYLQKKFPGLSYRDLFIPEKETVLEVKMVDMRYSPQRPTLPELHAIQAQLYYIFSKQSVKQLKLAEIMLYADVTYLAAQLLTVSPEGWPATKHLYFLDLLKGIVEKLTSPIVVKAIAQPTSKPMEVMPPSHASAVTPPQPPLPSTSLASSTQVVSPSPASNTTVDKKQIRIEDKSREIITASPTDTPLAAPTVVVQSAPPATTSSLARRFTTPSIRAVAPIATLNRADPYPLTMLVSLLQQARPEQQDSNQCLVFRSQEDFENAVEELKIRGFKEEKGNSASTHSENDFRIAKTPLGLVINGRITLDAEGQIQIKDPYFDQTMEMVKVATRVGNLILHGEEKEVKEALDLVRKIPDILRCKIIATDPLKRRFGGTPLQAAFAGGDGDLAKELIEAGKLSKKEVEAQAKVITSEAAEKANNERNQRILAAVQAFGTGICSLPGGTDEVKECELGPDFKKFQTACEPYIKQLERVLQAEAKNVITLGYMFDLRILGEAIKWFENNVKTLFRGWWTNASHAFWIIAVGKFQSQLSSRDAQFTLLGCGYFVYRPGVAPPQRGDHSQTFFDLYTKKTTALQALLPPQTPKPTAIPAVITPPATLNSSTTTIQESPPVLQPVATASSLGFFGNDTIKTVVGGLALGAAGIYLTTHMRIG